VTEAARIHAKRRRLVTGMLSLGGHAAFLAALLLAQPDIPPPRELPAVQVQLVELPPPPPPAPPAPKPEPEPDPAPPTPPPPKVEPKPKPTPPRRTVSRPVRTPPPDVTPIEADSGPVTDLAAEVSDAELASATKAGSGVGAGGGGGRCDMVAWLQAKLRKDRRVQAAMAQAHQGRAIRVWNGDWVTHPGQEGKGLASVREAIMWEVAFAPEACRQQRVRGLIVVSLDDGPASPRVVVGAGDWRWSDLLFARSRGG